MIFLLATIAVFVVLWGVFFAIGPALERGLAQLANRTARFRYADYLPVFVLLGAGLAVTIFVGDAFVDVAELVQSRSPRLESADATAHQWARGNRSPGATYYFAFLAFIGKPVVLYVFILAASVPLVARDHWRWAAYLHVTVLVGGLLNKQLKLYFARARPDLAEALREASGYSFPSGHAMGSTLVFGALAYVAFRSLRRWRWRAAALSLATTLILAIAASRVYLGVHWISDVGAGIAAGMLWVMTTTVAYETFRRIRMIRSLRARRDVAS